MKEDAPFLVAIDGPAGAGKSTVSREVARRLGFTIVDTGALYRAVALAAQRAGVAFDDDEGLASLVGSLDVELEGTPGAQGRVSLGGEDVSREIRSQAISLGASRVSSRRVVREGLLGLQRRLARQAPKGAILEGRDVGTVVFPDADAKFFLTASVECRAKRRWEELVARGEEVELEEVLHQQIQRDERDMERALAPLRAADDAITLDSSTRSAEEVVEEIVAQVRAKIAAKGSGG